MATQKTIPYRTLAQRRELGRAQRKVVRRVDQGHWSESVRTGNEGPLALLQHSMKGRVPQLIDEKYRRMVVNPFGFFRGAAPIMAADLAGLPHTEIYSQLCGDGHVRNLGAYAGIDGQIVFDINDFDETTRGPFEWDLKRIATSFILAGMEAGSKPAICDAAVMTFAECYRELMRIFATMPLIEMGRWQVHRLHAVKPISDALLKAQRATPLESLEQLTQAARGGQRMFRKQADLTLLNPTIKHKVIASLAEYRNSLLPERVHLLDRFNPIDATFKVVGTGSVGLRDYVVYLEGNGEKDPLFLQVKEETASAYEPYLPHAPHKHNGQRVAEGQRLMQLQTDPFLGWTRLDGRDYLVRQLNDHKGSIDVDAMSGDGLCEYAAICAELFARSHARAGDAGIISGYLGTASRFDKALLSFARAYAEQTVADWKLLCASRKKRGK
jgi:uncharacterized protein (DUF2252 family)